MEHSLSKASLRSFYRARRARLDARPQRSAAICERLITLPWYQQATALHCFIPMDAEVDTRPLLQHALQNGKRVVVPIVDRSSPILEHSWLTSLEEEALEEGVFGTLQPRQIQPAYPGDWELTVVPLIAFDQDGYRLGYGGGYYDRLLAVTPTPAVGVAFAMQEAANLPRDAHDVPLDWIVTEDAIRSFGPAHK